MTSTSKSAPYRDVAAKTGTTLVRAAKVFGTGSAGIGLQLATRGYSLAKHELERRKVRRASKVTAQPRVCSRNKKLIALGAVAGVAAGAALLAAKRRHTPEPPADAPPSLEDYADTPMNGSAAPTPTTQ
ncbi:hypothetical protein QMK17_09400 [Rhodococcus sp. G-MC3]|uniref:hypothetical protein n=1 Tax=Rhodococcus sp. G-MC3 TaxID=3046209 RepID=UPI0024BB082E|nr:hypothetical protein [Rhodococcus sp. G-MC3]MDJ0393546.1 hypothetical protein [Rhodococcus sp. G-MC3]